MNKKSLVAFLLSGIFAVIGYLEYVPQAQEAGYVRQVELEDGSYKYESTTGNAFIEFRSQYLGEMVEKDKTFKLIEPVKEQKVTFHNLTTGKKKTVTGFAGFLNQEDLNNIRNIVREELGKTPPPPPKCPTTPPPCPSPIAGCPCVNNPPPPPPPPPPNGSWGIQYTKIAEAHKVATGASIKVCVVDTGVQDNHPGLQGVIIKKLSVLGDDGGDRAGHGTHVSGTVASVINGIGASRAKIISIKVLGDNGSGSMQGILTGFQRCLTEGANVLSASLGSDSPSPMFQQAIQQLASRGMWVVMAGGNNGQPRFSYPAAYAANVPKALAVVATGKVGEKAPFSQFDRNFPGANTISAPGLVIRSTCIGGGYCDKSGTSMATPLVAGIVAVMLEAGKTQLLGNTSGDPNAGVIVDAWKTVNGG